MSTQPLTIPQHSIHLRLAGALRVMTTVAAMLIFGGGAWMLALDGGGKIAFAHFTGVPDSLKHPVPAMRAAVEGNPAALVQLGIMLLVATPVLRVVAVFFGYIAEKDYRYVLIAGIVLLTLALSFMGYKL